MSNTIILTCEHATNHIPEDYKKLFTKELIPTHYNLKEIDEVLAEHWSHDIGALDVAETISKKTNHKLHAFPVSRLLIEGNRYRKKSFFSNFSKNLNQEHQEHLKSYYWKPHVETIDEHIKEELKKRKSVLHLAIHSFTPTMKGITRKGDVGVLYEPKRKKEKALALQIQIILKKELPELIIRRNYPYSGASEGLAKLYKKRYQESEYNGIEIEINNKHLRKENETKKKNY